MNNSHYTLLIGALVAATTVLPLPTEAAAPVLFSDDFDTDKSAQWNVLDAADSATSDFTIDWAFDYSKVNYTLALAGKTTTNSIPKAPSTPTGGASKAVRLQVNTKDVLAERAAVNLYAKDKTFQGDYSLRFDMWLNYNGSQYGGTGSTVFGIFGINHLATQVNWAAATPLPSSDGVWFAVTGEAGANGDYRAYEGDPTATPLRLLGADAGFLDRDGNGTTEFEPFPGAGTNFPLHLMFATPPFETPGVPGKRWVKVEIRQIKHVLTWVMDGYVIAQRENLSSQQSGSIMIGLMDIFTSIPEPAADNFVLFDNLQVLDLSNESSIPSVSIVATDSTSAEPGTSDLGTLTVSRKGATDQALTVTTRFFGSASAGLDYGTNNLHTITIPAGSTSADVSFKPRNDGRGEVPETAVLVLTPGAGYEVEMSQATVTINDDGDTTEVSISALDPHIYEGLAEDVGTLRLFRDGDTAAELTVLLEITGSARAGSDFEAFPTSVTFAVGEAAVLIPVVGSDDTSIENDESIVVTLKGGSNYTLATNASATVTIRDNDREPEAPDTVVFSETFEADTSSDWGALFSAGNSVKDYLAVFAYDASIDSIPASPGGSTRVLKVTVNKDATASAASVNLFPKGKSFAGNYALRFNMFVNYDSSAPGTTEHAIFGVGHSAAVTNRHAAAGSDGWWFAVETDGSASGGRSYVSYVSTNATTVPSVTSKPASEFTGVFNSPPFKAPGAASGQWVEVEVISADNQVTLKINGFTIFSRPSNGNFASGNIMLGHMDTFNSIGGLGNATYFDNVRVIRLPVVNAEAPPRISGVRIEGGQLRILVDRQGSVVSKLQSRPGFEPGTSWKEVAVSFSPSGNDGSFLVPMVPVGAQFFRIGN